MFENIEEKASDFIKRLFGDTNEKRINDLKKYVEEANTFALEMEKLSDEELANYTNVFKQKIKEALDSTQDVKLVPDDAPKLPGQFRNLKDKKLASVLEEILPKAFAVVREASRRVLGMRHFDVQLYGGAALHFNKIAEMRTGEGKTLVATLPAYLNALSGRGVHVVTVNDYLARRDSEWMGRLYNFLGLSVGLVYSHQSEDEKASAYQADITYGTNHEFGFDYLRDNMRTSIDELVQRPYYYAIVDEVDNILIDEARTPLIISGFPVESHVEVYQRMSQVAPMLVKGKDKDDEECDYWVDEKTKNVLLTERGTINGEKLLGVSDLYDVKFNFAHHLVQALRAKELFRKDIDYVVRPNEEGKPEITIVDEFTGRMMVGRRWSDGLHQAIEAKEHVPIQEETLTFASITYQNLFRLYPKLSGMTGTAMTEAKEFRKVYNLDTVTIPTNRKNVRVDYPDVIYKTEKIKFQSVVEEIVEMHELGRPVLVGTTSIEKSELIDDFLSKPIGMTQFLVYKINKFQEYANSKKLSGESLKTLSKIFERPGLIDIEKLIKAISEFEKEFAKQDYAIELLYSCLKTAKVVDSIRKGVPHHVLNAKHHEKEAMIVAQAGRRGAVTVATNMAGRGTDILLGGNPEYLAKEELAKKKLDPQSQEYLIELKELTAKKKIETDSEHELVVNSGGLHIIGTERHEARRIDNQLRGRAGRQGDPGSTKFYLSLEDNLMRIFGGQKIAALMDFMKADEEIPIEHNLVTSSIERAQKKVEAYHFDSRKQVLQYDDVLNTQREVIYRERRMILEMKDIKDNIRQILEELVGRILENTIDSSLPADAIDLDLLKELTTAIGSYIPYFLTYDEKNLQGLTYDDIQVKLNEVIDTAYTDREGQIGVENLRELERQILLRTIDNKWIDYLHNIDILREGIHLRGYGQRDPLQEYKREAFDMFNRLLQNIQEEAVQLIFHAQPVSFELEELINLNDAMLIKPSEELPQTTLEDTLKHDHENLSPENSNVNSI